MEFVFWVIGILGFLIMLFHLSTYIIRLWTGCNQKEAVVKLQNYINGKSQITLSDDSDFAYQIWCDIRKIIGEKNFKQLEQISSTSISQELMYFGESSRLPYIAISTYYEDDHMKRVLESVVLNVVKSYLKIYGYSDNILLKWRIRPDLDMPYMKIYYGRNPEEHRVILSIQNEIRKKIIATKKPVKDITEVDDLDG